MKRILTMTVLCILGLSACGGDSGLTADSEVFAGLDPAVVAEVIANPVAWQKVNEEPAETRESMAQGIVTNFIVCRDTFRAYEEWIHTGVQPTLAPMPVPTSPREPSYSNANTDYAGLVARIESGDVQNLKDSLTLLGSCGNWIPAEPGDVSGPTIRDAVLAAS